MSNDPVGRRPRSADLQSTLRLVALAAVSLGVVLLAAAAFVLSYEGIHHIALRAGVSPGLAKLYPLIFDVMLVVAGAAALALRGAGWWARCYAWGSLLILLAAMAVGNAVYASGTALPAQPTKIAVAIIPWVLLLMAFGLLLEMLRHFRTARSRAATAAGAAAPGDAVAGTVVGTDVHGGPPTAATQAAVSGGKARELPRVDLDTLLGPRAGEPPAIALLHGMGTGQNDGHQVDPVSYGEETGYVHPDSYLDEGEYSPHGDTGGPESPAGLAGDTAGDGTHPVEHGNAPAEAPATAEALAAPVEVLPTPAGSPAAPAAGPADPETARTTSAETAATSAAVPANSESPAGPAAGAATAAEPLFTPAAPATATEPQADPAAAPETAAEPLFTPAVPATAETPANHAATPATAAEAPATPAEPPTTPAEPPAPTAETPDAATAAPAAPAAPVGAQAGEAASGTGNGLAAGGPAGADTTADREGAADAEQGSAGVTPEAVGAEGPALERIRSTPTRPEE
jgi:Protein of unknown function (DUF2637)